MLVKSYEIERLKTEPGNLETCDPTGEIGSLCRAARQAAAEGRSHASGTLKADPGNPDGSLDAEAVAFEVGHGFVEVWAISGTDYFGNPVEPSLACTVSPSGDVFDVDLGLYPAPSCPFVDLKEHAFWKLASDILSSADGAELCDMSLWDEAKDDYATSLNDFRSGPGKGVLFGQLVRGGTPSLEEHLRFALASHLEKAYTSDSARLFLSSPSLAKTIMSGPWQGYDHETAARELAKARAQVDAMLEMVSDPTTSAVVARNRELYLLIPRDDFKRHDVCINLGERLGELWMLDGEFESCLVGNRIFVAPTVATPAEICAVAIDGKTVWEGGPLELPEIGADGRVTYSLEAHDLGDGKPVGGESR